MVINTDLGHAALIQVTVHQPCRKMGLKRKEENAKLSIHSAALSPASSSVADKWQK